MRYKSKEFDFRKQKFQSIYTHYNYIVINRFILVRNKLTIIRPITIKRYSSRQFYWDTYDANASNWNYTFYFTMPIKCWEDFRMQTKIIWHNTHFTINDSPSWWRWTPSVPVGGWPGELRVYRTWNTTSTRYKLSLQLYNSQSLTTWSS